MAKKRKEDRFYVPGPAPPPLAIRRGYVEIDRHLPGMGHAVLSVSRDAGRVVFSKDESNETKTRQHSQNAAA